jgi:hypothetical protein
MSHFTVGEGIEKTTPSEWLKVGSQIGTLVNEWSERDDLIVYVGEKAGVAKGAPAIFNPTSAEIEVNTPIAFGFATPDDVGDMNERRQQFEFPRASGAIFHEALHARYSTWDLSRAARELSTNVCGALHLLEESRIESLGVRVLPENKSFLRACALEIVLGDIKDGDLDEMNTTRQAAHMAALTMARVDAGVLAPDDIEPITVVIHRVLSTDMIADLSAIWREFHTLNSDYHEVRMYELAEKWEQTVKDAVKENGEEESNEPSDFLSDLSDAIKEAADSATVGANQQGEVQQKQEEYRDSADKSRNKADEMKKHGKLASEVFSKGSTPSDAGSRSYVTEKRKPTSEERSSAVKISQALEKAKYHDRVRTEAKSATPPGRLRTRALVQGAAYKERGVMIETEPFNRVQRTHTEDPNLTIGVMVDISGSMYDAMQPMASAAWILSEATRRVQGKVAMVYYGNGVFPTLKAGQHLSEVSVYSANDSTEEFEDGFQALDGALTLLHGSGARLLVIVSDGEYRSDQRNKAKKWIKRCAQAGVGVLWVGAGNYASTGKHYCNNRESVYTPLGKSATDAASAIGIAAATALTKAGEVRRA